MAAPLCRSSRDDVAAGSDPRAVTPAGEAVATCPDCALLQVLPASPAGARCGRCGARLGPRRASGLDQSLALTVTALLLLVGAVWLPLLQMQASGQGRPVTTSVLGAMVALNRQHLPVLAAVVGITAILLPAFRLGTALYLLLGQRLALVLPGRAPLAALHHVLQPWAQTEIFLAGVLVATVKLTGVFDVVPGPGLVALAALIALELLAGGPGPQARRPGNLQHSAAWLTAAAITFVPANLLPVMTTVTPLRTRSDTIASGVVVLWDEGSWGLATIVFVASILIPALKILALGLLLLSSSRGWSWRRRQRTALYRALELVGRWSMLDIFVMGVLAAMLTTRMAGVFIEPGAMAFAAVVVLTMLASASFDPRLIWSDLRPATDRAVQALKEYRHA